MTSTSRTSFAELHSGDRRVFFRREATDQGVEVAFTNASVDLRDPHDCDQVARALDVASIYAVNQVHGRAVVTADPASATGGPACADVPDADAVLVDRSGVAAMARAADCLPIAIVDLDAPRAVAVHAGRVGLAAGVVTAAVDALRVSGTTRMRAYLGPRACGRCYEVPERMADEVDALVPGSRSVTSWGTPALDLGAGAIAQLRLVEGLDEVIDFGGCTIEDTGLHSYRRDGAASGRQGVIVVVR